MPIMNIKGADGADGLNYNRTLDSEDVEVSTGMRSFTGLGDNPYPNGTRVRAVRVGHPGTWMEGTTELGSGGTLNVYVDRVRGSGTVSGTSEWTFTLAGEPGAKWHNGSGAPSSGLGADGDYYIDTTTGDVYEKVDGSWE